MKRWQFDGQRWRPTANAAGLHWCQLPVSAQIEILDQQNKRANRRAMMVLAVLVIAVTAAARWLS